MNLTARLLNKVAGGGRYPASMFSYDKATKTFSQELSSLDEGGRVQWYRQIYPDAADAGITIEGNNGSVDYYIAEEKRDQENELQEIILLPTPESERKVPGCKGTRVVLFND